MTHSPQLYSSPQSRADATRAIIVLPEIYGLNDFVKSVTDRAATELGVQSFGLDHFFAANGQKNEIGYDEHDKGASLMAQVTGERYLELLSLSLDEITQNHPDLQEIVVLGFCFGGKLAYLSGVDPRVSTDSIILWGCEPDDRIL